MKAKTWLIGAVLIGLFVSAALATQVMERTPRQLAGESTLIVDGKVTGVRSYWNEGHSRILTEAMVAVSGTHKGSAGSTVRVVQLGGVVGNVRMTAHGAVSWKRGEEVLLFLEPALPGSYQVAGFSQGKYLIQRDPNTGKAYVQQAMPPDAGTTAKTRAGTARVTMDQFLNEVLAQ